MINKYQIICECGYREIRISTVKLDESLILPFSDICPVCGCLNMRRVERIDDFNDEIFTH